MTELLIKKRLSIVALLTCHNRVKSTLHCLRELDQQDNLDTIELHIIMVDAGSSDETVERVSMEFPHVLLLRGDESLFWNGGMRLAFEHAIAQGYDYYLWLNDDTFIYHDAISRLLDTAKRLAEIGEREAIIVGATKDQNSGNISYSGWKRKSFINPSNCFRVSPEFEPVQCDTMNGNCVLIPQSVVEKVGNLDPRFTHAIGDMDYGFRARRAGCSIWVAPGFVGECSTNTGKGLWTDRSLPWRERFRRMLGPKGLPPREWLVFTRRHSGPLWPLFWANPYVKMLWAGVYALFANRGDDRGK